jgi:hypothetical protein
MEEKKEKKEERIRWFFVLHVISGGTVLPQGASQVYNN